MSNRYHPRALQDSGKEACSTTKEQLGIRDRQLGGHFEHSHDHRYCCYYYFTNALVILCSFGKAHPHPVFNPSLFAIAKDELSIETTQMFPGGCCW